MPEIKRYIIRCKICHQVRRKAKPALYCSTACKQVAWRRKKAAREALAEAAALAEAERQQQHFEAVRQRRADTERLRREIEQQQRDEAERQRRAATERQQRDEAKAKHRQRMLKVAPYCSKCGEQHWNIRREKVLFGMASRLTMTCTACYAHVTATVSPSPCPACSLSLTDYDLDGDGILTCKHCQQQFSWGEWITNWKPGEPGRLAQGHTLDTLEHTRPYRNELYKQPVYKRAVIDDSSWDDDND